MTDALLKTYDPAGTESSWQQAWEIGATFHPDQAPPESLFLW